MLVKNQHRHRIEVSVIPGAHAFEVGSVESGSSKAFRLPLQHNGVPSRVRIRCLTANDRFTTREVVWEAGQVVDLQVQPMLNLSRVKIPR